MKTVLTILTTIMMMNMCNGQTSKERLRVGETSAKRLSTNEAQESSGIDGKLYKYDRMAVNMIVDNIKGGLSFCDIAVTDDLEQFNANYLHLTETIRQTCQDILDEDAVIVGTSALTGTELDCIVNQYSGIYTNPFLAWGRYRKGWLKTTLPISFQFHHAQMDGGHAAHFLEELQKTINHV